MKHIILFVLSFGPLTAFADYSLSANGKTVFCSGPDDMSFVLNAKRTTVKYTVEGETLGAQKITSKATDGDTSISYTTSEGQLTLSDQGDNFVFTDDQDATPLECK